MKDAKDEAFREYAESAELMKRVTQLSAWIRSIWEAGYEAGFGDGHDKARGG